MKTTTPTTDAKKTGGWMTLASMDPKTFAAALKGGK